MSWAAIIALILPIIIDCFDKGAGEDIIRRRLRNPKQRHITAIRRRLNRQVRQDEPDMRRRDRRVKVDTLLEGVIERGSNATDEEIEDIMFVAKMAMKS